LRFSRAILGCLFIAAGAAHFIWTQTYASIVPDYMPAHRELVLISGAAEIAGGLGVLVPRTRRVAAAGLAILLVAVFPANMWMAQNRERFPGIPASLLWGRLPMQVPLIWWALLYLRKSRQYPR
jgi:uncharacterized membrane protein